MERPESGGDKYELRSILIEVTKECNAKCAHCGSRCGGGGDGELPAGDIIRVLEDIRDNIGTDAMLNITGGEPLMRKDLFSIMGRAAGMGFDWGMATNGTLITRDAVQGMRDSGMKTITVSIDGMGAAHERLRGLPEGSFRKIVRGLGLLKDAGFLDHLQVTFTANRENLHDLPEVYALARGIGCDSLRTSIIDPIGRAAESPWLMLGARGVREWLSFVREKNAEPGAMPIFLGCCHYYGELYPGREFECFAGKHAASILANGDISVCPNVPRAPGIIQGNIRDVPFSVAWKERFTYFRGPAEEERLEHCRGCAHWEGCRGDSLHTWDQERGVPKFCYRDMFEKEWEPGDIPLPDGFRPSFCVGAGLAGAERAYLMPEAYAAMRSYFRMGHGRRIAPEKQMALYGHKTGLGYVIEKARPSGIRSILPMVAKSGPGTVRQAEDACLALRAETGDMALQFLGFAHSHPMQEELQYSTGDEKVHAAMHARHGHYIGILVHPASGKIGAYSGMPIGQADLYI